MNGRSSGFSIKGASTRWWVMLLTLATTSVVYYGSSSQTANRPVALFGSTMGTTYRVVIIKPRRATRFLRSTVEQRLQRVVDLMSTYEASSEVSRFNAWNSAQPFSVSTETFEVLQVAESVRKASDGAFDVSIGKLVNLWGFGPDGRPTRMPSETQIAEALKATGTSALLVEPGALSKPNPDTQIDLSAVAKGYAVDRVAEALIELGHRSFLVEVGGEIRVHGEKSGGIPFTVGIEAPNPNGRKLYTTIALKDLSLATSGNYRNFYQENGTRVAHTIDPRNGRPVRHRLLSASVFHVSCAWADAWATALMASGNRAWQIAQENDLDVLLLYSKESGGILEKQSDAVATLRSRIPEDS